MTLSALLGGIFLLSNTIFQKRSIENMAKAELDSTRSVFENLKDRDAKMLSSALEVILQDTAIQKIYRTKNRGGLYEYAQPLFEKLKERYGITHWYFISPEGKTFLRVHNKDIYGDDINRFTFREAKDAKIISSGLELGKTAYALRTVAPYYDGDTLIGYVELGEEIDHFLKILKGETGNEFALIADKNFLSREDWRSVRKTTGLRDTWDDIENHVVISATGESDAAKQCFTEKNLEQAEKESGLFQQIRDGEKTFRCGGFVFSDASGAHSGAILSLIDVTRSVMMVDEANRIALSLLLVLFLAAMVISFFFSRSISRPIIQLSQAAQEIAAGNLTKRAEALSRDEVGQLAQSFNKMVDAVIAKAKQVVRLKDEFVFVATHELRTPVTAINGYLEMIFGGKERLGQELKENLLEIKKADERLLALVNDLLEVARTEADKTIISVSPQNMKQIVSDVIQEVRPLASQRNILFRYKPETEPPLVLADSQRLKEILVNLIGNAIKYNKINGEVVISHELNDGFLVTHIRDTGIGFSEEEKKHMCEKFWRSEKKEVRQIQGTGLGLFITKELIERMSGTIWIESKEGYGSTFSFKLPIPNRK